MQKENNFEAADFLKISLYVALAALVWNLPTLGNNLMPRNFMGWFGMIVIATSVLAFITLNGKIYFHRALLLLFIPSLAILIHGLIFTPSETMSYYMWLAIGATFTFPIFFISLLQVNDEDEVWLNISNLLLFVLTLQIFISNILPHNSFGTFLINFLPIELKATHAGFQQPNLLASFGVSLFFWSWVLRLNKEVTNLSWLYLALCGMVICFVVLSFGSRTAFVGLIFGVAAILWWSRKEKIFNKSLMIALLILLAFVFQGFFGGLESVKGGEGIVGAITEVSSKNTISRFVFWHVSLLSGLDNPFFGSGIGNFQESYYKTFLAFKAENAWWFHVPALAHPHNEVLIHWVEMGLFGIVLVVLPVVYFFLKLLLKSTPHPMLLVASVLPIILHTQSEMVLHASGAHWLLLGLIIASLTNREWLKKVTIVRFASLLPFVFGFLGIYVVTTTAIVGKSAWLNTMMANQATNIGQHLKILTQGKELNHWVLGTETNDRVIKAMMATALNSNNVNAVRKFIPRLEDMAKRWQQTDAWAQLAQAYLVTGNLEAYKIHIDHVRIFDSAYAKYLEDAFDLHLPDKN